MRTTPRAWQHIGVAVILGLIVSVSWLTAQEARGTSPRGGTAPAQNNGTAGNRGGRGNSNSTDVAQARQQIQANKKAAIDSANAMYRLAVTTAQHEAKSGDPGAQ